MDKRKIESKVTSIADLLAEEIGVSILDAQFEKESGQWYLRVYIECDTGVNIDHCVSLSRALDSALDAIDNIFPDAYLLEVSSPGDMPIRGEADYDKLVNRWVSVNTYKNFNGKNKFEGWLRGRELENVLIEEGNETIAIPLKNISKARLAVPFMEVPKNVSKPKP